MNGEDGLIALPCFRVFLPGHGNNRHLIFGDWPEILDGIGDDPSFRTWLRLHAKSAGLRGVEIDCGGDGCDVSCKSKEVAVSLIRAIASRLKGACATQTTPSVVDDACRRVLSWKPPKKQAWQVGDLVSVPLSDGTFAVGQVLPETPRVYARGFVLFGLRVADPIDATEPGKDYILAIVGVGEAVLDNHRWKVIRRSALAATVEDIPPMHQCTTESSDVIEGLADYYFGLKKWEFVVPKDPCDLLIPIAAARFRAKRD